MMRLSVTSNFMEKNAINNLIEIDEFEGFTRKSTFNFHLLDER